VTSKTPSLNRIVPPKNPKNLNP